MTPHRLRDTGRHKERNQKHRDVLYVWTFQVELINDTGTYQEIVFRRAEDVTLNHVSHISHVSADSSHSDQHLVNHTTTNELPGKGQAGPPQVKVEPPPTEVKQNKDNLLCVRVNRMIKRREEPHRWVQVNHHL